MVVRNNEFWPLSHESCTLELPKNFFRLRFPTSRYCFLCLLSVCHSVNIWPLKWEVLFSTFLAQAQQRPREAHSINPSGWSELIWIRLRSLVAWKNARDACPNHFYAPGYIEHLILTSKSSPAEYGQGSISSTWDNGELYSYQCERPSGFFWRCSCGGWLGSWKVREFASADLEVAIVQSKSST